MNLATGATHSAVDRGDQDPNAEHGNVVAYMMVLYPMFMSLGIVGSVVGIFYQIMDFIREKI
jgi:hypothetical protein